MYVIVYSVMGHGCSVLNSKNCSLIINGNPEILVKHNLVYFLLRRFARGYVIIDVKLDKLEWFYVTSLQL